LNGREKRRRGIISVIKNGRAGIDLVRGSRRKHNNGQQVVYSSAALATGVTETALLVVALSAAIVVAAVDLVARHCIVVYCRGSKE
jgi:hypothetical protein